MISLIKNDIFQNIDNKKLERVLWIETDSNLCLTIDLKNEKLKINFKNLNSLESELSLKKIKLLQTDPTFKNLNKISNSESKLLEERLKIVEYIHEKMPEPEIYDVKKRAGVISRATKELGISKKAIYKYLRLYWQGGFEKSSLISNRDLCGGKGKEKKLATKKVGRPNSYVQLHNRLGTEPKKGMEGRNVNEHDKAIFRIAINRYLPELSLPKAYKAMKKAYYTVQLVENGNLVERPLPAHEIPTLDQFEYWVERIIEEDGLGIELQKEKVGEKKHNANYKGLHSTTSNESFYPGVVMEVDSTRPPIHLLNKFKTDTIGTPVLYLIVDAFSKYICSVSVILENPSRNSATSVILNLVADKVKLCKKYGIDISEDQWPNCGLPRYLIADRGEFAGSFSDHLAEYLKIGVQNTPSYAGYCKGNVEQNFNLIEEELTLLPGRIKADYKERGARDYRKDARLNLYEFTKVILLTVIKLNNRYMKDYRLSEEMINDRVIKTPIEIFKWGLKKYPNAMKSVSEQSIKANIMDHGKATVTELGISFSGKIYENERACSEEWSTIARSKGYWDVDICFDDQDIGTIYIFDHLNNTTEECRLHEIDQIYSGMSYEEILMDDLYDNVAELDYRDTSNNVSLEYKQSIEEVVQDALTSFDQLNDTGKVNIKNSRAKRKEEIDDMEDKNTSNSAVSRRQHESSSKEYTDEAEQTTRNKTADLLSRKHKKIS